MSNNLYLLASSLTDSCQTTGAKSFLSVFADFAVNIVDTLGVVGVLLATALETILPFIPSEIVLPLVGASASPSGGESLNLVFAIIWSVVGALIGAVFLYLLSNWVGLERIKWIFSKIPLVGEKDVDTANNWFTKYGKLSVLIGRCIPVVRVLVSIPAGLNKMKLHTFIIFSAIGTIVWNSILIVAGYILGDQWCHVEEFAKNFTTPTIIIIVLLVAVYVFHIVHRARKTKSEVTQSEIAASPSAPRNDSGGEEVKSK
jgi:membrane protein DedA with SNARE-associated domain